MTATEPNIKCLFVDIGGVLLTNGWDHESRALAARTFGINREKMEDRHRLVFDAYEQGKLRLKDYLKYAVFFEDRPFTPLEFQQFMFLQSKPYPPMLELVRTLKAKYHLKIVVVSNEARELTLYRVRKFHLGDFVDVFVSSCFVGMRKPDPEIFHRALDIAQVRIPEVVYIENTPLFVQAAEDLGIRSITHKNCALTRAELSSMGLT